MLGLVALAHRRLEAGSVGAATADRVFGGAPDERDQRVFGATMAVVGLAGLAVGAAAPVAVGLGVSAETVVGLLSWVLIATGVVAFVVIDRRS